jgi:hypothetical protein
VTYDDIIDVINRLGHHLPPHPDLAPRILRVNTPTWHSLKRATRNTTPGVFANSEPLGNLFGLDIVVDDTLPAGAWRITTADGTLLRDSRSTNPIEAP